MSALAIFRFESHQIRTVAGDNGEVLFVAKDVAEALGYSNTNKAVIDHCKKAKSLSDIVVADITNRYHAQNQALTLDPKTKLIPESDVYRLTMRSKLDTAEQFQDWVVEEVLPQIRRTGSYIAGRTSAEMFAESARLFLEQERRVLAVEAAQARQEAQVCALKQEIESNTRMLQQIETAGDHFTIIGWHRYAKMAGSLPLPQAAAMGKLATKFCKDHEIAMGETPDPRFGVVHTYPKWVLDDLFGESVQ